MKENTLQIKEVSAKISQPSESKLCSFVQLVIKDIKLTCITQNNCHAFVLRKIS